MTNPAIDLPPSPPSIPGLTVWFQSVNPGAQPIYANSGKLQVPAYYQYLGTPHDHTPALDEEMVTLKAYMDADEVFAMNSNKGWTSFGNDGPVFAAPTTSLSEPLHAATPAIQQAIVGIAQTAVALPSDHSAHTWLSTFFGAVASLLLPIGQKLVVDEAQSLAARIPGATP